MLSCPGDFFIPNFRCPHRAERLGVRGDGGKWVCGMDVIAQKKKSVIYSFGECRIAPVLEYSTENSCKLGLNGESSFEAAILERAPGAQLYGYDYSVHSVCHIFITSTVCPKEQTEIPPVSSSALKLRRIPTSKHAPISIPGLSAGKICTVQQMIHQRTLSKRLWR